MAGARLPHMAGARLPNMAGARLPNMRRTFLIWQVRDFPVFEGDFFPDHLRKVLQVCRDHGLHSISASFT